MEIAVDRGDALGDVLGKVADPLQIIGDAQRAHHVAQIDRHRLASGDGENRLVLDLALQRVDGGVASHDALCQIEVPPGERRDRIRDQFFGEPAHFGDLLRQLLQVGVERLGSVFVHRHR